MEAVIDVEADGLKPTKLYCLSAIVKGEKVQTFTDYDDMRNFLKKVTIFVGHNIRRWDIPVLERILKIKIDCTIVDTLALSWALYPKRRDHGLADWGEDFGVPKPPIEDWFNLPLEDYIHRCQEDVEINRRLWNQQYSTLIKLYGNEESVFKYTRYLTFKMYCAHLQEISRWKLDIEHVKKSLVELNQTLEEKTAILKSILPPVKIYAKRTRPVRFVKKDGSLTSKAIEWLDLLDEMGLPPDTEETKVIIGEEEPNPGSTQQQKDYLFSLGWVPRTFEYKDKKEIPQINQKHGKGICPSIIDLFEKEPKLEALQGISTLTHRISILEGFLEVQEDEYVIASVNGVTNTLRFKHRHPCVNLPKPDRLYAAAIRTALIAPDGYELCGADMSSLEDRLKQHYIFPLDPEYVKSMLEEGYDPHLKVALTAKMMTEEEVDEYKLYVKTDGKEGSKKNSRLRDMAKNGGYANA